MPSRAIIKWTKRLTIVVATVLLTLFAVRIYDTQSGPALEPWHTFVPHELSAAEMDKTNWQGYLAAESRVFDDVKANVTDKLSASERIPLNRYFDGSPVYPEHFVRDWNRSYELIPQGEPRGAVVLLHGLTDSPYSLRHIAENYRQHGYVAVGIRLPAHGTVPGALTNIDWRDWLAATRLAVREARSKAGGDKPLHIVGFSNGGALAMKYALDALDDPQLAAPQRLVLISPMIGVTSFARFAGIAGWPAVFPAFAKAAWLGVLPEFNPFKYNSFPVNGARQSYLLSNGLQQQIALAARDGKLARLAPVLTFQSVMDSTVSTRAVIRALYNELPANGSELVLFDVNRTVNFGPLLRPNAAAAVSQLLPPTPRRYQTTVIANASPESSEAIARVTPAGETTESEQPLGMTYPTDIYSLSHVALPFPVNDSLYGRFPEQRDEFGISLGTLAARGERSVLVVDLDSLMRIASNPFFPYLLQRIDNKL
ncbi:Thermostable monoacylglycerol lipase [Serratia grimesii]|uniref:alpha/beta hydrolase n=1 Tax=Serratia grimesii TaxID=82995 RepID=UPI0021C4E531|nr:alpha/beta hydrolase [Serratia grimesii]CAI2792083.1 Thermostable monoacylglycerol lipase [Serratia grimesii]